MSSEVLFRLEAGSPLSSCLVTEWPFKFDLAPSTIWRGAYIFIRGHYIREDFNISVSLTRIYK